MHSSHPRTLNPRHRTRDPMPQHLFPCVFTPAAPPHPTPCPTRRLPGPAGRPGLLGWLLHVRPHQRRPALHRTNPAGPACLLLRVLLRAAGEVVGRGGAGRSGMYRLGVWAVYCPSRASVRSFFGFYYVLQVGQTNKAVGNWWSSYAVWGCLSFGLVLLAAGGSVQRVSFVVRDQAACVLLARCHLHSGTSPQHSATFALVHACQGGYSDGHGR